MDWLFAAILAMGISVGVTITDKYVLARFTPRSYTFLVGVIGLLSLLVLPLSTNAFPSFAQWGFGLFIGVVFAYIIYTSFIAYQKDEISRFAALNILSAIVITAGAALFFGERLTPNQYWAFGLFMVGAFLLATRIETSVFFEGKGSWHMEELPDLAMRTLTNPLGESTRMTMQLGIMAERTVAEWVRAAKDPQITWIRFVRKLRLIRGLGWYLLSLALYIPYVLFSKQLNGTVGVINGWVAIRVGLFLGSILIMHAHWHELRVLRKKRILALASVKELFGMSTNYLLLFAMANGIVGVVQSLWALEAVGVLVVSVILAHFHVIKESLARRDLLQKAVGVLLVAIATVLLFR